MTQAEVLACRQQFVARTAQLLLGVYLLALLAGVVAVLYDRLQVSIVNAPYFVLPAFCFAKAIWTATRFRRATEAHERRDLHQKSAVETAFGLVIIGSFLYYWLQDPAAFFTAT